MSVEFFLEKLVFPVALAIVAVFLDRWRTSEEKKTNDAALKVIKELLTCESWAKRTFQEIKSKLGGFSDDELRKLLVRSGAVRFNGQGEQELWGLISRNKQNIKQG